MSNSNNLKISFASLLLVVLSSCAGSGSNPTASNPVPGPAHMHQKCYQIQDYDRINAEARFMTQFGTEEVALGPASHLCTPAIKIVGEGYRKKEYGDFNWPDLKCYRVTGSDPRVKIRLDTAQFDSEKHDVGMAIAACLPANMAMAPNRPP